VNTITEQFRPKTFNDLVGNPKAMKDVRNCIKSSKVCLLYGPPGNGKTSSVYAIASDMKYKVREWNASDSRRKEDLVQILRELKNKPFTPTVYLLDEIDGAENFNAIIDCVMNTKNPLVLICNNFYKIPKKWSVLV